MGLTRACPPPISTSPIYNRRLLKSALYGHQQRQTPYRRYSGVLGLAEVRPCIGVAMRQVSGRAPGTSTHYPAARRIRRPTAVREANLLVQAPCVQASWLEAPVVLPTQSSSGQPPTSTAVLVSIEKWGWVYVSVASSPTTSMPSTKLRMSALRSGNVPSRRKSRKSATHSTISSVSGRSTLRCSSWRSASSRAASNCSSRCLREKIRGDKTFQRQLARLNGLTTLTVITYPLPSCAQSPQRPSHQDVFPIRFRVWVATSPIIDRTGYLANR